MGFFDDPFGLSAAVNAGASLIAQKRDQKFQVKQTNKANAMAINEARRADKVTNNRINTAYRRDVKAYEQQKKDARQSANIDRNRANVDIQRTREYDRGQVEDARKYTEMIARRERNHQISDIENQYVRQREAAEKAGFNPLSVLGTGGQMTPQALSAGSSAFAASPAPLGSAAAVPGFGGAGGSVPMSYGAPIAVTPLASNEAVVGAVSELGQELTGSAAIERANETFWQELAAREAEQAAAVPDSVRNYPTVPGNRVPVLGSNATPVGNTSTSDFWTGFTPAPVPVLSGASPVSNLGAETSPDVVASGMSLISNNWLPWSDEAPYSALGDAEEVFQPEGAILNGPWIGAQVLSRGMGKAGEWLIDNGYGTPLATNPTRVSDYRHFMPGGFNNTRLQGGYGGY